MKRCVFVGVLLTSRDVLNRLIHLRKFEAYRPASQFKLVHPYNHALRFVRSASNATRDFSPQNAFEPRGVQNLDTEL